MGSCQKLFGDLKAGRGVQPIVARLLRFWEARNVKKGGELMGVDMLLLDEKATLIQGSISVHRLNTFKHLMHEGGIYAISGFDVTRSNPQFKLSDSNISIRFTEQTTFVEIFDPNSPIPTDMFRFRSHDELLSLANTNSDLPTDYGPDTTVQVILHQLLCTGLFIFLKNPPTHNLLIIFIDSHSNVIVTMSAFDGLASQLHQKLQSSKVDPRVLLATNVNPKFVGGLFTVPTLNA
ncbi:hypothetical protein EUTSA_v10002234mg [Eutrema salsugineum]|uniref:Replication protein A 70 kDa DNA-binding subunit B/D first OB fold domain-containing protein n=1 Tax=Eutrema salsugineum TaxID=72664 RepID=V4M5A4_EUTSA|nr:hypothetical protein EUTSA_v10002234mg [Eutrema salsugineum]